MSAPNVYRITHLAKKPDGWHIIGGMSCEVPRLRAGLSNISRYLDDRLTIIVMSNLDEDYCDTLQISGAIAPIYVPATKGKNPVKDW